MRWCSAIAKPFTLAEATASKAIASAPATVPTINSTNIDNASTSTSTSSTGKGTGNSNVKSKAKASSTTVVLFLAHKPALHQLISLAENLNINMYNLMSLFIVSTKMCILRISK